MSLSEFFQKLQHLHIFLWHKICERKKIGSSYTFLKIMEKDTESTEGFWFFFFFGKNSPFMFILRHPLFKKNTLEVLFVRCVYINILHQWSYLC